MAIEIDINDVAAYFAEYGFITLRKDDIGLLVVDIVLNTDDPNNQLVSTTLIEVDETAGISCFE